MLGCDTESFDDGITDRELVSTEFEHGGDAHGSEHGEVVLDDFVVDVGWDGDTEVIKTAVELKGEGKGVCSSTGPSTWGRTRKTHHV